MNEHQSDHSVTLTTSPLAHSHFNTLGHEAAKPAECQCEVNCALPHVLFRLALTEQSELLSRRQA